ncbi:hypothetical protein RI129_001271, partial [Pyrocoelia pectoralis]
MGLTRLNNYILCSLANNIILNDDIRTPVFVLLYSEKFSQNIIYFTERVVSEARQGLKMAEV